MTKITKRDVINMMMAEDSIKSNETYMAFLEHEIELLDKKASSTRKKPAKEVEKNTKLKEALYAVIASGIEGTASEIQRASLDEEVKVISNQKASALLKQLFDEGLINKKIEKRKTIFFDKVSEVEE